MIRIQYSETLMDHILTLYGGAFVKTKQSILQFNLSRAIMKTMLIKFGWSKD